MAAEQKEIMKKLGVKLREPQRQISGSLFPFRKYPLHGFRSVLPLISDIHDPALSAQVAGHEDSVNRARRPKVASGTHRPHEGSY
jgi:hypothetical protein